MAIPANQRQRLANMKMGEHMGRRPVAPQQKKNDGVLDKIGGAVSAVGDAASKAGGWVSGGATKEQLTSPTWWAKGLGNATNDFLIQPAWRTASGQNIRTVFSPDSTWQERLNAAGEDILNIATVATGGTAKGLAVGVEAASLALAKMMAGQGARQAIRVGTAEAGEAAARIAAEEAFKAGSRAAMGGKPTVPVSPRTQQMYEGRAAAASADAAEALERARALRATSERPEWSELANNPDMLRLFHSSPEGQALPPQLLSMEDAARLPGRRGDGSSMLLDGGLYATDSGYMSSTYPSRSLRLVPIPRHIDDIADDLFTFRTGRIQDPLPLEVQKELRQTMSRAMMDKMRNIDDPMDRIEQYKLLDRLVPKRGPVMGLLHGGRNLRPNPIEQLKILRRQNPALAKAFENVKFKYNPTAPTPTYREVFENLPESMNIDDALNSLLNPFKYAPDTPSVIKIAGQDVYAAPGQPAYFIPNTPLGSPSGNIIDGAFPGRFLEQFARKQLEQLGAEYAQEMARQTAIINAHMRPTASGYRALMDPDWRAATEQRLQAIRESYQEKMQGWKHYSKTYEPSVRPYVETIKGARIGVDGPWLPGTNYWDLPIQRGPGGGIESIGGIPAVDIGRPTPEMVANLKGAFKKYFDKYGADKEVAEQAYDALDDMLRTAGSNDPQADSLMKFRQAVGMAGDAIIDQRYAAIGDPEDFTRKEELYETLREALGYGALPHPGGVTMGGSKIKHQAVSFSQPELLPPSTYLPGTAKPYTEAMGDYNQALVNKYFWDQAAAAPMRPAMNFAPAGRSRQQMANRLAAAAWFSNQGINSMYGGSNR